MIFAPAIGMATCTVLAWMCFFVAALLAILVGKQFVVPNEGLELSTVVPACLVFTLGGFACLWGARKIRQAANGQS
jgi:hypothetical protein